MNDIEAAVGERLSVGDIELEVIRRGQGRPVLLLHGLHTVDPQAPFLDLLGRRAEVIVPSHPGFGHSERPADFDTVYDLVHLYLDVSRRYRMRKSPSWDCPLVAGSPRKSRSRAASVLTGSSWWMPLASRSATARHRYPGRFQHLPPGGGAEPLA